MGYPGRIPGKIIFEETAAGSEEASRAVLRRRTTPDREDGRCQVPEAQHVQDLEETKAGVHGAEQAAAEQEEGLWLGHEGPGGHSKESFY